MYTICCFSFHILLMFFVFVVNFKLFSIKMFNSKNYMHCILKGGPQTFKKKSMLKIFRFVNVFVAVHTTINKCRKKRKKLFKNFTITKHIHKNFVVVGEYFPLNAQKFLKLYNNSFSLYISYTI